MDILIPVGSRVGGWVGQAQQKDQLNKLALMDSRQIRRDMGDNMQNLDA